MKRFISCILVILSFSLAFSITPQSNAADNSDNGIEFKSFTSDTFAISSNKSKRVTFSAEIKGNNILPTVIDENGNVIVTLRDDGCASDARKNDNTYTGTVELSSSEPKSVNYTLVCDNIPISSRTIHFRGNISMLDMSISDRIWSEIEKLETDGMARGLSDEEIVNSVYNHVYNNYSDYISGIRYESDIEISFEFNNGLQNIFARHNREETSEPDFENNIAKIKESIINNKQSSDAVQYLESSLVGVYSPYYGIDHNFTNLYRECAAELVESTDLEAVESFYGGHATVESFKNFDKYGVILVDSHGSESYGGGYICIPFPGSYDENDITEGHLIRSGSTVFLTGTFFEKYCEMLPNSIVYIGICYGMGSNRLYQPLLNHGAGFVCGYDNSVTFIFDNEVMQTFVLNLGQINSGLNRQYTAGEVYDICIEAHGSFDPYGRYHANFVCFGNGNIIAKESYILIQSASMPETLTIYYGNEYPLIPTITPLDANCYTMSWSSSSPDVVSVDENGTICAKAERGSAVITCTVHDMNRDITLTCAVTVDGIMPESGMYVKTPLMNISIAESGKYAQAVVLPLNASNTAVGFESMNPEIATVSAEGFITPVSVGTAIIRAYNSDNTYSGYIICNITMDDADTVLNAPNGNLTFINDSESPFVAVEHEGKLYMMSTNHDDFSTASLSSTIYLNAGDVLSFDWKTSSERKYDFARFIVNGEIIKNESGLTSLSTYTYTAETSGNYEITWCYEKDYSGADGEDCFYLGNVDVISNEMHTVTFVDRAGNVIETKQVKDGASCRFAVPTLYDGSVFITWDKTLDAVNSDITVSPVYIETDSVFSVIFVDADGTLLDVQQAAEGKSAVEPFNAVNDAYIFKGWDVDFSEPIHRNTIVRAVGLLRGDTNQNNTIDTGDAVRVLRHCSSIEQLSQELSEVADYNRDGVINTGDAVSILRFIAFR